MGPWDQGPQLGPILVPQNLRFLGNPQVPSYIIKKPRNNLRNQTNTRYSGALIYTVASAPSSQYVCFQSCRRQVSKKQNLKEHVFKPGLLVVRQHWGGPLLYSQNTLRTAEQQDCPGPMPPSTCAGIKYPVRASPSLRFRSECGIFRNAVFYPGAR